ncbi:MAG: RDD family protein [Gammaproteobacteria bacterium]|nr:RDD family protein [Gammaproteobacteria bacterium]
MSQSAQVVNAGFWVRLIAYLLDLVILIIPVTLINFASSALLFSTSGFIEYLNDESIQAIVKNNVMALLIWGVYYSYFESSSSQGSVGKIVMGLRVVNYEGKKITFSRALLRYACKILSALILMLGFITIAFTEKKQGIHDMLADTLVIKYKA